MLTTPFHYIDTDEALDSWVDHISAAKVIAVDIEGDSLHCYEEKVCLIQMTALGQDAVIDPLEISSLEPLRIYFENPRWTKIFHDATYDLMGLRRDFGFAIKGVFDTMLASRLLGIKHFGLAPILKARFDFDADKKYQKSDWGARPLSTEQILYARADTHFLPDLYQRLSDELAAKGRTEWAAEEFSRLPVQIEQLLDRADELADLSWWRIRGVTKLSPIEKGRAKALHAVRDGIAEKFDRPAFKIFSDSLITDLACHPPATLADLGPRPGLREGGIRRFGAKIMTALEDASEIEEAPPTQLNRRRRSGRFVDDGSKKRYDAMRALRTNMAKEFDIDDDVLLANGTLHRLALLSRSELPKIGEEPLLQGWRGDYLRRPLSDLLKQMLG